MLQALMAVLALAAGLAQVGGSSVSPANLSLGIDWTMPDRFGADGDGDGRIDLPNTSEYAHNRSRGSCSGTCSEARFQITLEGELRARGIPTALPVRSYQWVISGGGLEAPLVHTRVGPRLDLLLEEGEYLADLRAVVPIPWGHVTLRARSTFVVEDLLVVALGDSYAAGEGNPEVPRRPGGEAVWADGDGVAESEHAEAHRSTAAWPARVARVLEERDPRTSVTFISLAETGARIDRGLVAGLTAGDRSQMEQLSELVGSRNIDLALIQVGGNDVGFARLVQALVDADPQLDPVCYDTMIDQALKAVHDGDWRVDTTLRFSLPFRWTCRETVKTEGLVVPGLDGLPAAFDRLAAALRSFPIDQTLLVGYPDPTGSDQPGARCEEIVGDTLRPLGFHEVDAEEQALGVEAVLRPLNRALLAAAGRHGWTYVGGVSAVFAAGHGYCGPWPDYGYPDAYWELPGFLRNRLDFPSGWYRAPGPAEPALMPTSGDVSWYRTARQSSALQGPGAAFATSGTLHPNELGHSAVARLVLATVGTSHR